MGLSDARLAANVGAVGTWISWQAVLADAFIVFALAAVYNGAR